MSGRYLIVEARFYEDIADKLAQGAVARLEASGAHYVRMAVPGALEIPSAIAMVDASDDIFLGYIALGCVIRGETSHYDIVAGESARALMELSVKRRIAIGNGILTVERREQAVKRADPAGLDKGGFAAGAAMAMVDIKAGRPNER